MKARSICVYIYIYMVDGFVKQGWSLDERDGCCEGEHPLQLCEALTPARAGRQRAAVPCLQYINRWYLQCMPTPRSNNSAVRSC